MLPNGILHAKGVVGTNVPAVKTDWFVLTHKSNKKGINKYGKRDNIFR